MRRIPTTSLRSTLLALLLTLCLALPALAAQKEGLLLVAFGTSVPEAQPALTAIDKEFKAAFPPQPRDLGLYLQHHPGQAGKEGRAHR